MSSKGVIVYLDDERRSYLNATKAKTGKAVTEIIRDGIDLHRDLNAAAGRSTGKLAEALCTLVDVMAPEELQQATKALYAIREAYAAGARAEAKSARAKATRERPRDSKTEEAFSGKDNEPWKP